MATKVCARGAAAKEIKATTLKVNNFNDKLSKGNNEERNFKTGVTSQVKLYLGFGGIFIKTPFINLVIKLQLTHHVFPINGKVCKSIALCKLMTEYDFPIWNK